MTVLKLDPGLTREAILKEVVAAARRVHELLEAAVRQSPDPEERRLYARLAEREAAALRELSEEEDRLDAEAFVLRALDV
jgi:hypothetical protein